MKTPALLKKLLTAAIVLVLMTPAVLHAGGTFGRDIVPGTSIGQVRLGKQLPDILGKPSNREDTMGGHHEATYISRTPPHYHLDVLSDRISTGNPDEHFEVVTVRVESPYFRTASGAATRRPWIAIQRHFPHAKPFQHWLHNERGAWVPYTIYDVLEQGIAFEVADTTGICQAIYVHHPSSNWKPCGKYTAYWEQAPTE